MSKKISTYAEVEQILDQNVITCLMIIRNNDNQCKYIKKAIEEMLQEQEFKKLIHLVTLNIDTIERFIVSKFDIRDIPTTLIFTRKQFQHKILGGDWKQIRSKLLETVAVVNLNELDKKTYDVSRYIELINKDTIMLFMKGSPDAPKCGFSQKAVEILKSLNMKFGYFDILQDDNVRQGLKKFSKWPTYPQLYYKGKLIGGLDIMVQLNEENMLKEVFE